MFAQELRLGVGGLLALFAMTLLATIALAASPSELLEKAIYTEETVGNLEEAIKLYEQVIAEGKAGTNAAASAQFRLAECYLKQGKEAEATAAFRTFIEDYPDEKDLVAKAAKHLPSKLELLPAPWVDGERMHAVMRLPSGVPIGTMIYLMDEAEHDGKKVWRCSSRGLVTVNDASSFSEVLCEKEGFVPISSFWKHTLIGQAEAVYSPNSVEIKVVGRSDPIKIDFKPPAFDNEQCVQLFRRLPLKEGFKTTLQVVTSLGGNKIEVPLSVSKTEKLTVPAGTFECFKLDLGLLNQTFWVSNDEHRYVVRFAAGGVTADLANVEQVKAGEATKVSTKDFSLTLPAGWLSFQPDSTGQSEEHRSAVFLLDPRADATADAVGNPREKLRENQKASPKALIETAIAEYKNSFPDLKLRDPGVNEMLDIEDQPAAGFTADFTKGTKKMVMVGMAVFGEKSCVTMQMTAEVDKFEELQKGFGEIVASVKVE